MKRKFPGYFMLTGDEKVQLWNTATIIPDANVLLHFFRQDRETVNQIFGVFNTIKDRLWVPGQAAEEFHRNRIGVIFERRNAYSGITKYFKDLISIRLPSELGKYKPHPVLDIDQIIQSFSNDIEKTLQDVKKKLEIHPGDDEFNKILLDIGAIFEGKVGEVFNDDEINSIIIEGEHRYRNQIPPGYKDAKDKDGKEKYGDLIIWKEIMRKSEKDKSDIILVTDDKKQDWWLEHQGEIVSPRPELIKEFQDQTNQKIMIYRFKGFLEDARKYIDRDLPSIEIVDTASAPSPRQRIINDENKDMIIKMRRDLIDELSYIRLRVVDLELFIKKIHNNAGGGTLSRSDSEKILECGMVLKNFEKKSDDLRTEINKLDQRILFLSTPSSSSASLKETNAG